MSTPISFQIDYSVDDISRVARFLRNRSVLYQFSYIFIPVSVALIMFMVIRSMTLPTDKVNYLSIAIICLIPAAILCVAIVLTKRFLDPWLLNRGVRKLRDQSPSLQAPINFKFSSENIESSSDLHTSVSSWRTITKAIETNTDFLFFGGTLLSFFVPKRAFNNEGELYVFSGLVRENINEVVVQK